MRKGSNRYRGRDGFADRDLRKRRAKVRAAKKREMARAGDTAARARVQDKYKRKLNKLGVTK